MNAPTIARIVSTALVVIALSIGAPRWGIASEVMPPHDSSPSGSNSLPLPAAMDTLVPSTPLKTSAIADRPSRFNQSHLSDTDEAYFEEVEGALLADGSTSAGIQVLPRQIPNAGQWVPEGWMSGGFFPVDLLSSPADSAAIAVMLYASDLDAELAIVDAANDLARSGWQETGIQLGDVDSSCFALAEAGTAKAVCLAGVNNAVFMSWSTLPGNATGIVLLVATDLAQLLLDVHQRIDIPEPRLATDIEGTPGVWSVAGDQIDNVPEGDSGSEGSEDYPAEIRDNFITSCSLAGNATVEDCTCMLEVIEDEMPLDDFIAAEMQVRLGEPIPALLEEVMVNAVISCEAF